MRAKKTGITGRMVVTTKDGPGGAINTVIQGLTTNKEWLK